MRTSEVGVRRRSGAPSSSMRSLVVAPQFLPQFLTVPNDKEITRHSLPPYDPSFDTDVGNLINRPPRKRSTLEADESAYIFIRTDITESTMASLAKAEILLYFFGYLKFT